MGIPSIAATNAGASVIGAGKEAWIGGGSLEVLLWHDTNNDDGKFDVCKGSFSAEMGCCGLRSVRIASEESGSGGAAMEIST